MLARFIGPPQSQMGSKNGLRRGDGGAAAGGIGSSFHYPYPRIVSHIEWYRKSSTVAAVVSQLLKRDTEKPQPSFKASQHSLSATLRAFCLVFPAPVVMTATPCVHKDHSSLLFSFGGGQLRANLSSVPPSQSSAARKASMSETNFAHAASSGTSR
jgi:hypothetical protein